MECPSVQQVFITIMMLCSVKYPAKHLKLQKIKTMKRIISGMVLILVVINIPSLYGYGLAQDPTKNSTDIDCFASDVLTITVTSTALLIRYFIPFVLMFIMNIFIIKYFRQSSVLFPNVVKRGGSRKNFLLSIIIVNILFFVLYSPMSILFGMILVDYLQGVAVLSQTIY
jgi:hypothetical protein